MARCPKCGSKIDDELMGCLKCGYNPYFEKNNSISVNNSSQTQTTQKSVFDSYNQSAPKKDRSRSIFDTTPQGRTTQNSQKQVFNNSENHRTFSFGDEELNKKGFDIRIAIVVFLVAIFMPSLLIPAAIISAILYFTQGKKAIYKKIAVYSLVAFVLSWIIAFLLVMIAMFVNTSVWGFLY